MHQQQQEIKHKENNKIYNSLVPREISKYKVPRDNGTQFHNISKLFKKKCVTYQEDIEKPRFHITGQKQILPTKDKDVNT